MIKRILHTTWNDNNKYIVLFKQFATKTYVTEYTDDLKYKSLFTLINLWNVLVKNSVKSYKLYTNN